MDIETYQITNRQLYERTDMRHVLTEIAKQAREFCNKKVKQLPEAGHMGVREAWSYPRLRRKLVNQIIIDTDPNT